MRTQMPGGISLSMNDEAEGVPSQQEQQHEE
jgi:hypothetical protein